MAKFDLKGMLSERSAQEIDLPEQKTVYRNPEDLIPSKDNFYSTEDTEKLKQSIRALGILQPLLIEERDGKDYLLAGHRRRKCCLELIEEGFDRFKRIPCVYKPKIEFSAETETDEIVRKMVIIQSNTYREKTDWEKMTESLQMEELVKELREKTDLEGKTREIVSDLIGVSSTQIGRYHSISSNLSEELMEAFKQNKLNVSTAAELAGLNEKYQNEACKLLLEGGQVTLNAAKLLKAQQEQERDIPGQMTIDQALHPHKPEEINTPVGDLGCGTTNDRGIAIVDIDPAFSETINSGIEYQVFLQKEGDGDIWVAKKDTEFFMVRGTPNLKFSWEVKCIQKSFEHLRLDEKEVQEAAQKDARDTQKDYNIIIDTVVEDYDKEMEELINESN